MNLGSGDGSDLQLQVRTSHTKLSGSLPVYVISDNQQFQRLAQTALQGLHSFRILLTGKSHLDVCTG